MRYINVSAVKTLKSNQFWLLGIIASLIAILETLTFKSGDYSQLGMSFLFLFAVSSILGEKRDKLTLESGVFPSFLGGLLIAFVLWLSVYCLRTDSLTVFTHLSPFVCAIAVGLLASGFKGLKQYWQEITILFFLGIPKLILLSLIDISPITAKFSTFLLWYSGFNVVLQKHIYITLATGSIKVYSGCSGVELISHLLGLSVIALLMFPVEGKKRIYVPIMAIIIAFIVNGIRVALLAVIVAQKEAFNYWHEGDGSRLFGMIAVLMLGFFYFLLLRQAERRNQGKLES